VPQAVGVGFQAAQGLAYAHRRGFVHRDVKPANLLFDESGRLQVADFGLARALSEASWTEPVGATVGTARYASPEQAQGVRVDGQADVYGLALTLYESVTGVVPFGADTVLGTLMARVDQVLPEHDDLGPLYPLLQAAAAPHPGERLDAARLVAALGELARRLPEPEPLTLPGTAATGLEEEPVARTHHAGWAGEATAVGGVATTVDLEHGTAQHPIVAPDGEKRLPGHWRRQIRRHSGMATAAAVALLALLVAQQAGMFRPMVAVPPLTGLTRAQAAQTAGASHLSVTVVGHRRSPLALGDVVSQVQAPGTDLREGSAIEVVLSSGPPPVPVPDLSSVTGGCAQAAQMLQQANLQLGSCTPNYSPTVPMSTVMSWSPKGSLPPGSKVDVVYSGGPAPVTVPSLTGDSTCDQVNTTLTQAGFQPQCSTAPNASVPAGQIVSENPSGQAQPGSTIAVVISAGPVVTMPPLVGSPVGQAEQQLQQLGFTQVTISGPAKGHVWATDPGANSQVSPTTTVTLYTEPF
jgi:beta-lactam-binding protein with PASTA domain